MAQDDAVTHRIIEHASVQSLQECSQTFHVMAAPGQGGVRQPLLVSDSFISTQQCGGESWLEHSPAQVGSGLY